MASELVPCYSLFNKSISTCKKEKEEYIYRLSSLVRNCFKVLNINRKMGTWGGNITPECTNLKFQTHSKNNLRDKNTNRQILQKRQIQNTKNNKWDQIQNNYKKKEEVKRIWMHISCSYMHVAMSIQKTRSLYRILRMGKFKTIKIRHPPYFTGWLCCSCNIYKLCL